MILVQNLHGFQSFHGPHWAISIIHHLEPGPVQPPLPRSPGSAPHIIVSFPSSPRAPMNTSLLCLDPSMALTFLRVEAKVLYSANKAPQDLLSSPSLSPLLLPLPLAHCLQPHPPPGCSWNIS